MGSYVRDDERSHRTHDNLPLLDHRARLCRPQGDLHGAAVAAELRRLEGAERRRAGKVEIVDRDHRSLEAAEPCRISVIRY